MQAAIEAQHVSRSFGEKVVVRDATLQVMPGEITALVGPNGSGKTTLMLMLATLLKPDIGQVRIGGFDAATATVQARSVLGWMPDTLGSWEQLTVRETLMAVCAMYGIRGTAALRRVKELLDRTGLDELATQRTHTLSRGQKQRLSIARAIAHRPKVLLLDEPASGLDPEARATQRRMLTELAAEGVAILVTSHVLDELDQLATNVVFLREGSTEAPETVQAALHRGQSWRIRALDSVSLEAALTRVGAEWSRQQALGGVAYQVIASSEVAAAALLANLTAANVQVIEFGPTSSALEQAFGRLSHASSVAAAPSDTAPANTAPVSATPPPPAPPAPHERGQA
jgi:ABC-2 type transport system ATP-binding protein